MQGTLVNNLPVTLVNEGPVINYCSDCSTLYVNTSLIPLSQPRDLSYLFSDRPPLEFHQTKFDLKAFSRQQEETKSSLNDYFEHQERMRRKELGLL